MSVAPTAWLRPPRLRTDLREEGERHATWYELYFDLVFVAAVSQLATALSREPTLTGFLRFAGLFFPITWAWAGFSFYANRFDTDDVVYRLVKATAMLAIAALAVSVHSVMSGGQGSVAFALSYVVTRTCLLALYGRARRHATGRGRRMIDVYLAGFSGGVLLWLVSIAVSGPARYWLWAAALALELGATPVLGWRALGGAAVNAPHITERFGQFFIIVLGESVIAVVAGITGTHFSAATSVVAVAGFVIALCLWWIYFDLADTSVVGRGLIGLVYVYAHFPLLAGVASIGAGTRLAITQPARPASAPARAGRSAVDSPATCCRWRCFTSAPSGRLYATAHFWAASPRPRSRSASQPAAEGSRRPCSSRSLQQRWSRNSLSSS
jgi:low temperature requirement protein LtrA